MGRPSGGDFLCVVCGVSSKNNLNFVKKGKFNKPLCIKHYSQMNTHGEIIDASPSIRSKYQFG